MPSTSERQRRFFFATKGKAWTKAHHFDKVKRKRKRKGPPKGKKKPPS